MLGDTAFETCSVDRIRVAIPVVADGTILTYATAVMYGLDYEDEFELTKVISNNGHHGMNWRLHCHDKGLPSSNTVVKTSQVRLSIAYEESV